jgi:hypothetical protein
MNHGVIRDDDISFYPDKQAVWSGQRMGGQALVVQGEELGVLRRHWNGAESGAHRECANGDGGGGVSCEGEHGAVVDGIFWCT